MYKSQAGIRDQPGYAQDKKRFTARARALSLLLGAAGILAGCATGEYTFVTKIGTGERLEFPLVNGSAKNASKDGITIVTAGLMPNPDRNAKTAGFVFAFTEESGLAPQSVVVEDVSERELLTMFEDRNPKLENKIWRGVTKMYSGTEPELAWLNYLGDTWRIYRFTVVKADGGTVVLHQAWAVPGMMKSAIRRTFDLPQL